MADRRSGQSTRGRQWQRRVIVLCATCSVLISSCSSTKPAGGGSSGAAAAPTPIGQRVNGGIVKWAQGPQSSPNYIFPIAGPQYFSVANVAQFQALMYRPLYWFGNDNKAAINYDYSLGNPPVFSDNNTTVTISIKPWKWSDGETVTGRDVVFFMNLLVNEKQNFGAYVPGLFPDNVKSFSSPAPDTVVLHLDKGYNPTWFLYNELSQITPLPLAWDKTTDTAPAPTADTSSLPDTTADGAKAVFSHLDDLAKNQATYVSSPTWGVVDGPWKLSDFTNTGQATFVPNRSYTGAAKPSLDKFIEVPFTADQSELDVIKTGPSNLAIGYLPVADIPQRASVTAEGYNVVNGYSFSINYFPLNLNNPKAGALFRQLYFRQAFQHLVNQAGWIHAFTSDSASPTYGVVPLNPANAFINSEGKSNPFSFSVQAASQLLSGHGWKVNPNGTSICQNAGSGPQQCGDGVAQGFGISFNLDYQAGTVAIDQEMKDLKSQASLVGIDLQLSTHPFAQVQGAAVQCKPADPGCGWTAENWGGGWVFAPDYYPSGEELFQTGAVANYSNYSDTNADRLISATTTASEKDAQAALDAYANYMQHQLPVVFMPVQAGNPIADGPTLVSKHVGGFSVNAFSFITPETLFLTQ